MPCKKYLIAWHFLCIAIESLPSVFSIVVLTGFSYSLDNSFVLVYYITVIYNSVMSGDD